MTRFWLALTMVLALTANAPAVADSWLPARTQTYASPDGQHRLTVIPRDITSPLGYFDDKVDGKEPAGQRPGSPTEPRGVLERRVGAGWETVWARPLVNDVSPVRALVSAGGDYVVTFDNWHSAGYGDDVVVIYGRDGGLIRALALSDILPESYIRSLPRSTSSMQWGGKHLISGEALVLSVVAPGDDRRDRFVEIVIDLPTGQVHPPQGRVWEAALRGSEQVNKRLDEEEAEHNAWLRTPLPAPTSDEDIAWGRYMFEAHRRVTPVWPMKDSPFIFGLPRPSDEDYAREAEWLVEIIEETDFETKDEFVASSPDQDSLVRVLVAAAPRFKPGSLKGKWLFLVVSDRHWPALQAAFAGSGAELVQINPDRPIPQRPERMPQ